MERTPPGHPGARTYRVGLAYSDRELVQQEYGKLQFWSRVTDAGIVGLVLGTLVTLGAAAPLLLGAVVARVALALRKAYFRAVYRVR